MQKIRFLHFAMIVGTVSLLYVVSASADNPPADTDSVDQLAYMSDTVDNQPTQGSLGTLRRSEIQSLQSSPSPQNAAMQMGMDDSDALQPVQLGDVIYVTGGIGDEERAALKAAQKYFNLQIMSSRNKGEFAGDVRIVVRDKDGMQKIDVPAGPLFYAKLPPGTYTVEGSNEGQVKSQKVTIAGNKPVMVHLNWK